MIYTNGGLNTGSYYRVCQTFGGRWVAMRRKLYSAAARRVRALPLRDTIEEAESDLAAYAAKRGWKGVEI